MAEKKECKIFVPFGAVGTGISDESFRNGVNMHPDAIVSDAGSTDSGPYYLGTGTCKYAHDALKEDFEKMIVAGHDLHVPVMIGSAGTCGTDSGVDMMFGIAEEVCREHGFNGTKIAKIYNPYLLHFPTKLDGQLPSFALLFSPAEIQKGASYQFRLNHSVKVDDPMELFRIRMEVIA